MTKEGSAISGLKAEVDPAEVGLDARRLQRIDRHFTRYVDDGSLPGWLVAVSRRGRLAHVSCYGSRDLEAGLPVEPDTLWRIYSMTKPVTSVAAMILYEEGAFELSDPVSRFIPAFADVRVYAGGSDQRQVTAPAAEPVRIWHLLTHTSGLTYGFLRVHPVDARYRAAGFDWSMPAGMDLATACEAWASLPLLFQPGTEWNYSVATDVLGRVIEVASGQRLDEFFAARVLGPLGMTDTAFYAGDEDIGRLAALYTPTAEGKTARLNSLGRVARKPARLNSGGAGLLSTAGDYHRFLHMLLGTSGSPAGELDGTRLLGPGDVRPAAIRGVPVRRGGIRPRLQRGDRPGAEPGGVLRGRAVLGRRGEYRVLDRSARRAGRGLLHPAAALQQLPDPAPAPPARLPGADRLTRVHAAFCWTLRGLSRDSGKSGNPRPGREGHPS